MSKIKVFTDGASRGNPGTAGIGIIVYDENETILETYREYLGITTNNQAEYQALLKSLDVIKKIQDDAITNFDIVEFYADSELMVKQVKGEYKIKNPGLSILNKEFHSKTKKLNLRYTIRHIDRSLNKAADKLANEAVDFKLPPSI